MIMSFVPFWAYQPSSQRFPCVCFIWGGRPHPEVLSPGYSLRNPVTFLESSENQKDARVEARLTTYKTKMVYPLYYLSGPTFVGFRAIPCGVKALFWIFTQGSLLKSSWYHGVAGIAPGSVTYKVNTLPTVTLHISNAVFGWSGLLHENF